MVSVAVGEFEDLLAGFHPVEGLARPVVGFLGDRVEVGLAVGVQVGALGEVLAQKLGQDAHLADDGLLDVFGVVSVGQAQAGS